jgi:hypothetical protein
MATTTLVPNGDVLTTGWISTGASFWTEIDEGIGSTDGDTTKINFNGVLTTGANTIKFNLTDTPADFATPSAVNVKVSHKKVISGDDGVNWGLVGTTPSWEIYKSDDTTLLIDCSTTTAPSLGTTYATATQNHIGTITGNKTDWDGAILRLTYTGITSGMADATRESHISTVDVNITYTPSGGATNDPFPIISSGYYPTQG